MNWWQIILLTLAVTNVFGIFLFPIFKYELPDKVEDFSFLHFVIIAPFGLGLGIACVFVKYALPVLMARPFKKCQYKAGDMVYVDFIDYDLNKQVKTLCKVVKNERHFSDHRVQLEIMEGSSKGSKKEIKTDYLKLATKLEQSLK